MDEATKLQRKRDREFLRVCREYADRFTPDIAEFFIYNIEKTIALSIADPLTKERGAILCKPILSDSDEERLIELEKQIGKYPTIGLSRQDDRAMDIIRKAATLLENKNDLERIR